MIKVLKVLLSAVLLILTFIFYGCVQPTASYSVSPEYNKHRYRSTAVIVNKGKRVPVRLIEDEFLKTLIHKGFNVVSRSDIDTIIEEWEVQHSGITDDTAVKLGRILNVKSIFIVSVTNIQPITYMRERYTDVSMGARMLDVENGKILWVASDSGWGGRKLDNDIFIKLSRKLSNAIPL